jgi:hypothetical protein
VIFLENILLRCQPEIAIALCTNGNRYSADDLHFFILADTSFRSFIMVSIRAISVQMLTQPKPRMVGVASLSAFDDMGRLS